MFGNRIVEQGWIAAFALAGLLMVGCSKSSGPERYPVTGTVTLDGQPMADGIVYFKTSATGAVDELKVTDGKFAGQAEAGKRLVEVNSYETVISDPQGMKTETQVNHVAPQFNTQSQLSADVTAEGANEYKFEVTSK